MADAKLLHAWQMIHPLDDVTPAPPTAAPVLQSPKQGMCNRTLSEIVHRWLRMVAENGGVDIRDLLSALQDLVAFVSTNSFKTVHRVNGSFLCHTACRELTYLDLPV